MSNTNGGSVDTNRNPNVPLPERRPLLKKSRTIADSSTAHFPGPLFPVVRRVSSSDESTPPVPPASSSTWSPRRSFESSDSSSTTTSDTFPGQTFGFADRDYVYPSFLGPNTTRNRVTVVKSSASKSLRKQPPVSSPSPSPSPSPVRSVSMPNNLVAAGGSKVESTRTNPITSNSLPPGSDNMSERAVKTVPAEISASSSASLCSSTPARKTSRIRSSLIRNLVNISSLRLYNNAHLFPLHNHDLVLY